ncbi:MAG: 16S rRNA (cytosine(1402)-N(4))-methyltransferase [Phycisphaerales bacterium]|nr:MAG: 16S rRNA (cytosine(1402)-N(4))-methyltransferase [Phycisphaerales bacterium]
MQNPAPSDPAARHVPVLPAEVLERLDPRPGETYLDCTAGLGGHAVLIAPRLVPGGTVILNDLDEGNLARARASVEAAAPGIRVESIHGNFADLPRVMLERGLAADMVLADLGFSSNQVDDAGRGLSFRADGPLDMRLDPSAPITAAELVNTLPEEELADVLWRFGEERASRRVAAKIVAARAEGPISTTAQLASIVRSAIGFAGHGRGKGGKRGRQGLTIDAATRSFQALRIAVNDELGSLAAFLEAVERSAARSGAAGTDTGRATGGDTGGGRHSTTGDWLRPGARVAIIAFHSLEDRPVKRSFGGLAERGVVERLTKRPVVAGEAETGHNPRARSAKMRAVRLAAGEAGG